MGTCIAWGSTSFVEGTISQIYKIKKFGSYRGGPAYYLSLGLKGNLKWVGYLMALIQIVTALVLIPGLQANALADAVHNAFGFKEAYVGVFLVILLSIIVFGGVKRIARVAEIVVPFMAGIYLLVATIIIIMNISELPSVIALIFSSAFGANATFGGIVGSAISMGVKRGVYSSEAGMGSAPHFSAAAEVSHPVKQGLVQGFSVYVDTLMVCSATAFMILLTGMYNVVDSAGGFIVNYLGNVEMGPIYTIKAVETLLPNFGAAYIAIALFFFSFTTLMAGYYVGETNYTFFAGKDKKFGFFIVKLIWLSAVYFGTIRSGGLAWAMNDVGVGLMVWVNLIGICILGKTVFKVLKDYDEQRKAGVEEPVFDPVKLGIENSEVWAEIGKNEESV